MNVPRPRVRQLFDCIGWLVRDTFRQSLASGVCWLMVAVTLLCVLVCLTVEVVPGEATGEPGPDSPNRLAPDATREASLRIAELVPEGAARASGMWLLPRTLLSPGYRVVAS